MDKSAFDQSLNTTQSNTSNCSQSNVSNQSTSNTNSGNTGRRRFNPGRWFKEEDDKLRKLVDLHGDSNWSEISKYFQDRSDVQCQQRWDKVVNPDLVKGPWTKEVCGLNFDFKFRFYHFSKIDQDSKRARKSLD